jgi:hypothetical protein
MDNQNLIIVEIVGAVINFIGIVFVYFQLRKMNQQLEDVVYSL